MSYQSFLVRIKKNAELSPELDAFVSEMRMVKYKELYQLIIGCLLMLKKKGITKGSVVALSVDDGISYMIIMLSLFALGAKQITLSSYDSGDVRKKLINQVGVTEIITDNPNFFFKTVKTVFFDIHKLFQSSEISNFKDFGEDHIGLNNQIYFKTSGTTGEASLIPCNEKRFIKRMRGSKCLVGQKLLKLGPIEYSAALYLRFIYEAGTVVFLKSNSLLRLAKLCGKFRVTQLVLSRIHLESLVRLYENTGEKFPVQVEIISVGSAVPFKLRKKILSVLTPLFSVRYGTTESGFISVAGPGNHDEFESSGLIINNVKLEIVDSNDRLLASGSEGVIRLKTAGMATGYYNEPKKTGLKFRNGWFYPGDMGVLCDDGSLRVTCRVDDMMTMSGLNIFPIEIEKVLESYSAVNTAIAVPIKSDLHGEIPVAAVTLKKGAETGVSELKCYARNILGMKSPKKILILSSIPFSANGKIQRKKIIEMFK